MLLVYAISHTITVMAQTNETKMQVYRIGSSSFMRKACPLIDRELERLERGKTSEQNIGFGPKKWGRRDSNPQAFQHMILSHARLPVPTLPQVNTSKSLWYFTTVMEDEGMSGSLSVNLSCQTRQFRDAYLREMKNS